MKHQTLTLLALLAAASLAPRPAAADDKINPKDLTDDQVVASMIKGIDYLLAAKKNDNWEITRPEEIYKGGETSLVLYALLHAGDSLQDNPDYHAKLHWRSKDLAPVIAWLSKNNPASTYSAALQASALTLVPKMPDLKPGEGSQPALDECKAYFIEAIGFEGGYTYVSHLFDYGHKKIVTIQGIWADYCEALRKNDAAQITAIKKDVDYYLAMMARQPGGEQWGIQALFAELHKKRREAATPAEIAEADGEINELKNYVAKLAPASIPKDDKAGDVVAGKKRLDDLISYRKTLQMPDPKDWKKMVPVAKDDLEALIKNQQDRNELLETVAKNNFAPAGDLSNAQYGALGAWAIVDFGMEMPNAYWTRTDRFWRLEQNPDGGWHYDAAKHDKLDPSTDTMGLAGIASLYICQEFLENYPPTPSPPLTAKPDKNIDAGLAWLNKSFKPDSTSMYYMYGVERVGLASGLKFFGTADWYKQGAASIINKQAADGSWNTTYGGVIDTAYALLFLARGRNPVVFNKLQYPGNTWNARAHDSAYLTRWMGKRLEKPINWQVVNLQVSPDEWLDAPILLITGSADPKFSKDDLAKLRQFVNSGGMIFSNADGANAGFTAAMKRYAEQLCDKKYEMRQLPRNHEIFSKEMSVDLPNPPPLMGLSNGIREIWIHSPQDIAADWQTRKYANKTSFEVGNALYYYASGMASLRSKLHPLAVPDSSIPPDHTIQLARIDYPGNSDPEPGAWPRLAKLARADFKTALNISTVKFADLDPKKSPIAHLTGTTRVTFTDDDAKALKAYLDAGGILFIDAAGGNPDFASSCRDLLNKIYPKNPLESLPPDHPIYTGNFPDGIKIDDIDFRKFGNIKLKRRVTAPALEAVLIDNHPKVLFSQYDIASGFLGTTTWGIIGYNPASAEALARNILLYSQNPPAK